MKTLVVFSGGQDSVTCLYWAIKKFGKEGLEAITFDYGQRHRVELECAARICQALGIAQKIVNLESLSTLSKNALTSHDVKLDTMGGFQNLPSSFVPGRNALFLTMAAAFAAPQGCKDIVIGVCQTDYSGYPDCRLEFIDSMQKSLSLAMDFEFKIHTPLMFLNKAETFVLARELGCLDVVLEESNTCYLGDREHRHDWGYGCGHCPACELRKNGYQRYLEL